VETIEIDASRIEASDRERNQRRPGKDRHDSAITPANYTLELIGEGEVRNHPCYVLRASPKRADKYLFEGNVCIDKQDFAWRGLKATGRSKEAVLRIHFAWALAALGCCRRGAPPGSHRLPIGLQFRLPEDFGAAGPQLSATADQFAGDAASTSRPIFYRALGNRCPCERLLSPRALF
jgi:hypothetical protein